MYATDDKSPAPGSAQGGPLSQGVGGTRMAGSTSPSAGPGPLPGLAASISHGGYGGYRGGYGGSSGVYGGYTTFAGITGSAEAAADAQFELLYGLTRMVAAPPTSPRGGPRQGDLISISLEQHNEERGAMHSLFPGRARTPRSAQAAQRYNAAGRRMSGPLGALLPPGAGGGGDSGGGGGGGRGGGHHALHVQTFAPGFGAPIPESSGTELEGGDGWDPSSGVDPQRALRAVELGTGEMEGGYVHGQVGMAGGVMRHGRPGGRHRLSEATGAGAGAGMGMFGEWGDGTGGGGGGEGSWAGGELARGAALAAAAGAAGAQHAGAAYVGRSKRGRSAKRGRVQASTLLQQLLGAGGAAVPVRVPVGQVRTHPCIHIGRRVCAFPSFAGTNCKLYNTHMRAPACTHTHTGGRAGAAARPGRGAHAAAAQGGVRAAAALPAAVQEPGPG